MDQLPHNLQELFDFINIALIAAQMAALVGGLRRFRSVILVGSWFRWKTAGYCAILLADMFAIYWAYKGDPLYAVLRLTAARLVVLWETVYCFHWRFSRASESDQFILAHLLDRPLRPPRPKEPTA